jgi:hypothetical protein
MNYNKNYQYSLPPFFEPHIDDNVSEIDLNYSPDFAILFSSEEISSREEQLERLEFLKEHTKELNIIANVTEYLHSISDMTFEDIEVMNTYYNIINGYYGQEPVEFFKDENNISAIEVIIYYLILKKRNNRREYYFEDALIKIYNNRVYFYFDKIKNKLYISFIDIDSEINRKTFDICKYFFADILLDIEARWRVYPAILDKTGYIIASEGEQLCGTII